MNLAPALCRRESVAMQSPEAGEIVTIQRLSVVPGREDAFVARFRELDVLGLAAAAAGGELERAMVVQDGSTFLVVTVWTSPAGIERWIASP
jgi:heme-degrading monooxygenase HmoA